MLLLVIRYPIMTTNNNSRIQSTNNHIKKPLSTSKISGILRGHKLATNDGEINFLVIGFSTKLLEFWTVL